jgi:choline kinase
MDYKVLITTSGTGSRLGDLTRLINKALVRIGKKPAISYVIESYPKEVNFVVTIGYLAEQIREFLPMAYPDRKFEFVVVDKYEGEGSSLGYSMLCAEKYLQCPFIFHACDTIVKENIPAPENNWIAGYLVDKQNTELKLEQYRTHKVINGKVIRLNDKGVQDFESVHIGLAGIKDYPHFWQALKEISTAYPKEIEHSDVHVIDKMIKDRMDFDFIPYKEWLDTGNISALENTRKKLGEDFKILDKQGESTYLFSDSVIKFFSNEKTVSNRVERAKLLAGITPLLLAESKHFYKYKYMPGELYSRVAEPESFRQLLKWAKEKLWQKNLTVDAGEFKNACYKFYHNKTIARVKQFLEANNIADTENLINNEKVPSVVEILNKADFSTLSEAEPYNFHGDFILDNIIKGSDKFCLLDWRQDFGGLTEAGDVYYDLGKLNHNLIVNHDVINDNRFNVNIEGNKVTCDIERLPNLVSCKKELKKFVNEQGWDWRRVNIITGIIWLNMSPLHHHPFNLFLFYFGKLNLWKTLREKL